MSEQVVNLENPLATAQLAQGSKRRSSNTGFGDEKVPARPYRIRKRLPVQTVPPPKPPAPLQPLDKHMGTPRMRLKAAAAATAATAAAAAEGAGAPLQRSRGRGGPGVRGRRRSAFMESRQHAASTAAGEELREKLEEALRYVEAAPTEMRRHQKMAHEVCRYGENLVSVISSAGIPVLTREMSAAQTQLVRARHMLENLHCSEDVELWRAAAMRELRVGGTAVDAALVRVRLLERSVEQLVGELGGEIAALHASSGALAHGRNVNAAEEFAARARRLLGRSAYGEWGADH